MTVRTQGIVATFVDVGDDKLRKIKAAARPLDATVRTIPGSRANHRNVTVAFDGSDSRRNRLAFYDAMSAT